VWHFDTETVATSRLARMAGASAEEAAWFVWRGDRIQMLSYRQVARAVTRGARLLAARAGLGRRDLAPTPTMAIM
jgi:hypothetical protein